MTERTTGRVCSKCREDKPLDEFHRSVDQPLGHTYWSKACVKTCRSNREARDPCYTERENAKARARYDPDKARRAHLRKKYALTLEQHQALLDAQDNKCVICRRKFTRARPPHVDHAHATGLVRGLLCQFCNWNLLGLFHEDAGLFMRAAGYLDAPPAVKTIGVHYVPGSLGAAS